MKNLSLVILLSFNLGVQADNLVFPSSEAEIIQALPTPKIDPLQAKCPPMIPNCELKSKRLEKKGLLEIVNDNPELPKVGALIQFDYDSATIHQDSYSILKHYGNALKGALKEAVIVVSGHTDYRGSEFYNQRLSERRAEAVKNFLVSIYDIKPTRLNIIGFGENKPLRGNRYFQSDTDREWNRRVEFIRLK